ncbi:Plasmodium exported protein, unknown function [Plasmodium knowlesi strain H]|uniref:Plasmodium RESA N-terminal domain-containing protein n=3 Tax=Plasmodium knowlesi TaxID=5850 RepID=A0A5K1UA42_PLAKH|nr:Plasmodium exported protein (PHIST), unknown function [Plasmodium knowlesi strain H]OTN68605.1 Uncharacterized protein PKNOH_S02292800 [Plasmodium knowlesi]CAA9986434.1 Plasmodium exported protein (PHIST), unknown function [Plasmodium knowlesi strain H]SBO24321.1 Plasmodium exported protein, unknown function [Plasmodium knowlesi strain H]SBO29682.1 Plasmodium exported protein, unknown function [Plasmodium knowlesi strain H]VVS75908.1 Plasmodium exported protein (PHIST), unknown function [Pl|eukprot:XP_002260984.1 hypothetical protein, conserved in Plasmodium species [Plasmodium knowlesi strain H]
MVSYQYIRLFILSSAVLSIHASTNNVELGNDADHVVKTADPSNIIVALEGTTKNAEYKEEVLEGEGEGETEGEGPVVKDDDKDDDNDDYDDLDDEECEVEYGEREGEEADQREGQEEGETKGEKGIVKVQGARTFTENRAPKPGQQKVQEKKDSNEKGAQKPAQQKVQGTRTFTENRAPKPAQQKVQEKKEIEEEKKKEEALLKEKEKSQNKLSIGNTKVYSGPLAALEKYEDELEEERKRSLRYDEEERRRKMKEMEKGRSFLNKFQSPMYTNGAHSDDIEAYIGGDGDDEYEKKNNTRSLRYDEEEHIDDEEEMNELLFGEFKKWENYGTHTIPSSHYEVLCFEDRLNDYEINKELNEMEKMPKKCELVSLYWQSFMNEKSKYINANKRLFKKFLELKKKQNLETMGKYNNKWKKCSKIVGTNFKEQREYVNDIFYTHMTKENLSKDEFKGILGHVRESWKEVTLKVTQECVALLEEPIVPDVKILDYNPYYGEAYFKVTRMSSPQVSS